MAFNYKLLLILLFL